MNKKLIASVVFGLLFLICFILYPQGWDDSKIADKAPIASASPVSASLTAKSVPTARSSNESDNADAEFELLALTSKSEPAEITDPPRQEYVWYTQPTSKGAIKNSKGDVIFQATDELPFVSMRSKASVSQVVIISANRNAFLIDPETKQSVTLPKQPPVDGAKGFETWEWINNDTLLAEYHVATKGQEGKPVNCCQGHSIAETKLYSYNLKSKALSRVVLPKLLEGTAFSVGNVASDGSIEVVTATNHLTDGKRVGWFKLNAHK